MGRREHLGPGALVPVGNDELWIFDRFHPVAAVLDRTNGTLRGLVSWPQVPPPRDGWRIAVFESVVWVQSASEGPLVRLASTGVLSAHAVNTEHLTAVSPDGAWCVPPPPMTDTAELAMIPPRTGDPAQTGHAVLVPADDEQRIIRTPGRVRRVVPVAGGSALQLEVLPWRRRPMHAAPRVVDGVELGYWVAEWASAWVWVPDGFTGDRVTLADHGLADPPQQPLPGTVHQSGTPSSWHDEESVLQDGWTAGGLVWASGWDRTTGSRSFRDRRLLVTGHDPITGERRLRVEVGTGAISGLVVVDDAVVFVVLGAVAETSAGVGRYLVRVRAGTGQLEVLADLSVIGLAGHGWPVGPRPIEAESYERACLRTLDGVQTDRQSAAGPRPLVAGMSEIRTELVRSWPDTRVRLSFAFDRRPGRLLVHEQLVFDDLGRPAFPEYDLIFLEEHLLTGLRDARDGPNGELLI